MPKLYIFYYLLKLNELKYKNYTHNLTFSFTLKFSKGMSMCMNVIVWYSIYRYKID